MSHILNYCIFRPTTFLTLQHKFGSFLQTLPHSQLVKRSTTVLPTTTEILHGIEFDTRSRMIKLPQTKLQPPVERVRLMSRFERFNKIAISNNKFQMASGQGSQWLIESPTIFSSMCSPPLSDICQFYF